MCVSETRLTDICDRIFFHWRNSALMYYGKRKERAAWSKRKEEKSIRRFKRKMRWSDGAFFICGKKRREKILIKEDALEFMKNMNPQQLVDVLLPKDDAWHVKTSGINASGNWFTREPCTQPLHAQYLARVSATRAWSNIHWQET